MIGLSGLITPSLDEMEFVAGEMQREGFDIPLLIGGATTSKAHTAVKIAQQYSHSVIHVTDASRAVTMVGQLLQEESSGDFKRAIRREYEEFRSKFLDRQQDKEYVPLSQARDRRLSLDWDGADITEPREVGVRTIEAQNLEELLPYIDWTPFFRSWDLHGRYPDILKDELVGAQARELYSDARQALSEIVNKGLLQARAVWGIFPANSTPEDDIIIRDPENQTQRATFHTLRQQTRRKAGVPHLALSDFVAPLSSGIQDYVGCFCVTAGFGSDELAAAYESAQDDYNAIMVKALADRLAEAFAEFLHEKIRRQHWGYAPAESLSGEEMIQEKYRGIRPAPGYPACPDHLEKLAIWDLLGVEDRIGVRLTESLAMWPAASVSGYYFAHPEARYFGLGKITRDQLEDYARRTGRDLENAARWLAPNLAN
jgi:5-methyltetrahydrofolate--homocysteine methyltransferase